MYPFISCSQVSYEEMVVGTPSVPSKVIIYSCYLMLWLFIKAMLVHRGNCFPSANSIIKLTLIFL